MQPTPADRLKAGLASLGESDRRFAESLLGQLADKGSVSESQFHWIGKLADRAEAAAAAKAQEPVVLDASGLFGLFDHAASSGLKFPMIRLKPAETQAVILSEIRIAPAKAWPQDLAVLGAKLPGDARSPLLALLHRAKPGESGTLSWAKQIIASPAVQAELDRFLRGFAGDSIGRAAAMGRLSGFCVFCMRPLTDHRSTDVGYGAICASRWGLPWGDEASATGEAQATAATTEDLGL
jgi:hypothetical protein